MGRLRSEMQPGGSQRINRIARWMGVTVSLWEEWFARAGNEVEYVAMVDVVEGLWGLPAPALASREALVSDALRDGPEGVVS